MNNYQPYNTQDLYILMHEPWEIADQPYKLHAAFALSCLIDLLEPEDEEEEFKPEDIWGKELPKQMVDRLAKDIAEDFNDAASTRVPITINGRKFTIRKVNAYDKTRLTNIFRFESVGDLCIIRPEGIQNLLGEVNPELETYEVTRHESKKNRTYLRQIIKLAEDDDSNGWDKLTDMEIVYYCWGLFYRKFESDNFKHFLSEYKDHIYVSPEEIIKCFNSKSELRGRPVGLCPFSYDKIQKWNDWNGQISEAINISCEEADDYWYEVALKGTFMPIDERRG